MSEKNKLKKEYICPYCKTEQTEVGEDRLQRVYYRVDLEDSDCRLIDYGNIENIKYYCPECDKNLPKALINCLNI